MKPLYTIHGIDEAKLQSVADEMRMLGAPTVRVVDCGDFFMALEATHRLAAAAQLGVVPVLQVLGQDDLVNADTLDWQDLCAGQLYAAGELAGEVISPSCGVYDIGDDGTLNLVSQGRYGY
jgi:hypothetical protein